MEELKFSITSEIGNILKVENFVDHFADFYQLDVETFGKINLSVVEAVNNAILYGNKQDISKHVHFFVKKMENKLFVTIKDEGNGFDFARIPDPTLPNNVKKNAGRGLFLMQILSDEIFFEDDGSKVTLVFYLTRKDE
jgi:serine/threonine-protein kinase RsbW